MYVFLIFSSNLAKRVCLVTGRSHVYTKKGTDCLTPSKKKTFEIVTITCMYQRLLQIIILNANTPSFLLTLNSDGSRSMKYAMLSCHSTKRWDDDKGILFSVLNTGTTRLKILSFTTQNTLSICLNFLRRLTIRTVKTQRTCISSLEFKKKRNVTT